MFVDQHIGIDVVEETFIESKRDLKLPLICCTHIGAPTWNKGFVEDAIDYIRRYKTPWIGLGDYLEFATRSSPGRGVFEQILNPDQQKAWFKEKFKPIRKKNKGLHHGNHDDRGKESGMTETVNLCESLDTAFLNSHAYHNIRVGEHTWKMVTTHGTSGAKLPHTKINAVKKLGDIYTEADIICMGHVHRLEHKTEHENKIVTVNGTQQVSHEHKGSYVLVGHFINYVGSYAQKMGLHPEPVGFPVLHFGKDGSFRVEEIFAPEVVIK